MQVDEAPAQLVDWILAISAITEQVKNDKTQS
jgi:hypothetical protein